MPLPIACIAALAVLLTGPAAGIAAVVADAQGTGWCGVAAYTAPGFVPQLVPVQTRTFPLGSAGIGYELGCFADDAFSFGFQQEQGFAGWAAVSGFGEARPGVLRGYLGVAGLVSPTSYGIGVIGTNPFQSRAVGDLWASFTDTFVVPPGATAPNTGDPTTLDLDLHLSCIENATYAVEWSFQTALGVQVSDATGALIDSASLYTVIVPGYPGLHSPCPLDRSTTVGVSVGETIKLVQSLAISLGMNYARDSSFPSIKGYTDALNTGRIAVFSADHAPLTGESGWVYDAPENLPTLPTLTTTTSTSTTLPMMTTTTLAGCGPTCGDATVQSECGETCDCPTTADEIAAAYGCAGANVVPGQEDCVVCRGCTLDMHICDAALPPTTSTTTTTTPGGATTTTTTSPVSAACDGEVGLTLARCLLDAALAAPLCGAEALPRAVDRSLRARLGGASKRLGSAAGATARKQVRLVKKAKHLLNAAKRASAAAAKRKKKSISAVCATTIATLTSKVGSAIAP